MLNWFSDDRDWNYLPKKLFVSIADTFVKSFSKLSESSHTWMTLILKKKKKKKKSLHS